MAANRSYEEVLAALDAMGAAQRSAPMPTGGPGRYQTSFVPEGGQLGISDADAAIAAEMQRAIDSGASAGDLMGMLSSLSAKYGVSPRTVPLNEVMAAVKYRDERARAGGRGPSGIAARPAQTPLTQAQRADLAALNDPSNAYDAKFGNVISAGLAPDIAGMFDPEQEQRMRNALQYYGEASPWASLGGEMAGYIAPSTAYSKLLSPAASVLATDVVLPTVMGAGENPNDRVGGASEAFLENMLFAGPANVAGMKLGDLAASAFGRRAAPSDLSVITPDAGEGLDVARAADRLERARAQGFNTDLPLYHGSSSDFSVFSPDREIFLTDRPDVADIYATARGEDKARKYGPAINGEPNVRPVFARMQKPLVVSDVGPDGSHGWLTDNMAAALGVDTNTGPKVRGRALYDEARRQGYDTVQIENMLDLGGEQTQYVPLRPEHVRSQFDMFEDVAPSDLSAITPDAGPAPQLALPAPPRTLALPAPGPGLPSFAAKPRGGQWWPDAFLAGPQRPDVEPGSIEEILNGLTDNYSPEAAARLTSAVTPEVVPGYRDWLQKALTKYYKTDFGSPTDPLRDLAERGLHYDPDMTPEKWQDTVNSHLMEDTIGAYTVPGTPGYDAGASEELLSAAPWLAKQPVTDRIYGINAGGLDVSYLTDEMKHALDASASGLPMDLAVRPESLRRMSLAQAAEHVGRINQFRVKQAEQERLAAALADANSPAVHPFKEYPEDPSGMRWVEFKMPELTEALDTDFDRQILARAAEEGTYIRPETLAMSRRQRAETAVREALGREGKILDICVGDPSQPYCSNIIEGKSRIFSLRDAEGRPHVTVETTPGDADKHFANLPQEVKTEVERAARQRLYGDPDAVTQPGDFARLLGEMDRDIYSRYGPPPENIVQIKGKKNSRPSDRYLPFVQDFVKSGQWGNVGDFGNTGLVRLPDGRYITKQQAEEGIAAIPDSGVYDPSAFQYMGQKEWEGIAPHFQGYAIGGRVSPDRCFCHHPFSAKG